MAEGRQYDGVMRVETPVLEQFKAHCKTNGMVIGFVATKLLREYLESQAKGSPGKKGAK